MIRAALLVLALCLGARDSQVALVGSAQAAATQRARIVTDEMENVHVASVRDIHLDAGWNGTVYLGGVDVVAAMKQQAVRMEALASHVQALQSTLVPKSDLCLGTKTQEVDCSQPASRSAATLLGVCEVGTLSHCCCDAAASIRHVTGELTITTGDAEGHVFLGNIESVTALHATGTSFESIDFGKLTRVRASLRIVNNVLTSLNLGNINSTGLLSISSTSITTVDLASLAHAQSSIFLHCPVLRSFGTGNLTVVDGHLSIEKAALTRIDFGNIASIGSDLLLQDNALTGLSFGMITTVGKAIRLSRNAITSLDFAGLADIGGSLDISHNRLTALNLQSLPTVAGTIDASSNQLTFFNVGQLSSLSGALCLRDNALTSFDFGSVRGVEGSVDISYNDLASIDMGGLTAIGGDLLLSNNALTGFDVNALVVEGNLDLSSNALTQFDFRGGNNNENFLKVTGYIDLRENPDMDDDVFCKGVAAECIYVDSGVDLKDCPPQCS